MKNRYLFVFLLLICFIFCNTIFSFASEDDTKILTFHNSISDKDISITLPSSFFSDYKYYLVSIESRPNENNGFIYNIAFCNSELYLYSSRNSFYLSNSDFTNPIVRVSIVCTWSNSKKTEINYSTYSSYIMNASYTSSVSFGVVPTGLVLSNHTIYTDFSHSEVVFEANTEQGEDYEGFVDGILSNGGNMSEIGDSIANSDWNDSLDENNTTTISNGSKSVGNGIKNITNIFSFVDGIKSAFSTVFKYLNGIDHLDEGCYPHFPAMISTSCQYGSWNFDLIDFATDYKYSPAKPFVDSLICGFAYLGFIWNAFRHLPSTIRGTESSTFDSFNVSKNGKD